MVTSSVSDATRILTAVLVFPVTSRPIITLTTDFGMRDGYVAAMKGVILSIAPRAVLIDVSHDVPPQDVAAGAFLLEIVAPYFPDGTIHLGVVDPGVGTARRAIALGGFGASFVGPDNGLFATALRRAGGLRGESGELSGIEGVELTDARFRREPVSATFHGRDIFAPAAAHLAAGVPLVELGPGIERIAVDAGSTPRRTGRTITGRIRSIDVFGNAISNIRREDLPPEPSILAGGRRLEGLVENYQETELAALIGSSGYLEIAARNGSAAELLSLRVGDEIVADAGDE